MKLELRMISKLKRELKQHLRCRGRILHESLSLWITPYAPPFGSWFESIGSMMSVSLSSFRLVLSGRAWVPKGFCNVMFEARYRQRVDVDRQKRRRSNGRMGMMSIAIIMNAQNVETSRSRNLNEFRVVLFLGFWYYQGKLISFHCPGATETVFPTYFPSALAWVGVVDSINKKYTATQICPSNRGRNHVQHEIRVFSAGYRMLIFAYGYLFTRETCRKECNALHSGIFNIEDARTSDPTHGSSCP